MFREVRRQNRILEDKERIAELLHDSEYGFLSLGISGNGYPYGIPMSYVFDEPSDTLYFHCAPEGQKLDNMRKEEKVSFCIIGRIQPVASQFTTLYESIIVFGKVNLELSEEEKRKCLRLLVKKYSGDYEKLGEKYMEKSWSRTFCFKIKIEHITAKAKYKHN